MSLNFRAIERNLCIVLDSKMPSILCPLEDNGANALICYGYVDRTAGLTLAVLALCLYVDGDYTIVNENKKVSTIIRAEKYSDNQIIPIKNVALMKRFEDRIRGIKETYYLGDNVEKSRENTYIDEFRHPCYPDDVQAILLEKGLKPEQIWVRLLRHICKTDTGDFFEGKLLNNPFERGY